MGASQVGVEPWISEDYVKLTQDQVNALVEAAVRTSYALERISKGITYSPGTEVMSVSEALAVFVSDDACRDVVEACGGVGGELRIHARCRTEPIPVRCCPALAAGAVVAVP